MGASVAAVAFYDWTDAAPTTERVIHVPKVEPYVSGEFFRRELPCLLEVLRLFPHAKTVIVDGYVWLDAGRAGLGAHLHQALNESVEVVGVAKTKYQGASAVSEVLRGASTKPLYVSAAGLDCAVAAEGIRAMHGAYRVPCLLKRVDSLCRKGIVVWVPEPLCFRQTTPRLSRISRSSSPKCGCSQAGERAELFCNRTDRRDVLRGQIEAVSAVPLVGHDERSAILGEFGNEDILHIALQVRIL
ncbi:MAG: hypothetical protein RL088_2715 [Verrucomicrobiota bacterium]